MDLRDTRKDEEVKECRSSESLVDILKDTRDDNHLAQWVRNSHQIPPSDNEGSLEEWTAEELAARAPGEKNEGSVEDTTTTTMTTMTTTTTTDEVVTANSDIEQQSTASSASLSTVKSNSVTARKNGSYVSSKESSTSSINICRRCHRLYPLTIIKRIMISNVPMIIAFLFLLSGMPTRFKLIHYYLLLFSVITFPPYSFVSSYRSGCPTPPLPRDPFSPLPPKISVMPPTPDIYTARHRLRNGLYDSPGRNSPNYTSVDVNTEDGSEDDLDCDGEPPYR